MNDDRHSSGDFDWHESVAFLHLLKDDADGLYRLLNSARIEHFRRAYVRAQFASIEGAMAVLRRHALLMKSALDVGHVVLLEEKTYRISDDGKVSDAALYVGFKQNVRFVFAATATAYGIDYALPTGGVEWRELKVGVGVRNRLAHPKTMQCMDVSDAEIQTVRQAGEWFMAEALHLLESVLRREQELTERRFRKLLFPEPLFPDFSQQLGLNTLLPTHEQIEAEAASRALDALFASERHESGADGEEEAEDIQS